MHLGMAREVWIGRSANPSLVNRILFGMLAFACLAFGGVVAFVALLILLRIQERPAEVWVGCALFLLLGAGLVAFGIRFGKRMRAGEEKWKWGFTRGGSERLRISGYFMFLSPIWYPLLEEGELRLPEVEDIPLYLFTAVLGGLMIRIARSALAEAKARYEEGDQESR